MTTTLAQYRELSATLRGAEDAAAEDAILDQLDALWYAMTPAERAETNLKAPM